MQFLEHLALVVAKSTAIFWAHFDKKVGRFLLEETGIFVTTAIIGDFLVDGLLGDLRILLVAGLTGSLLWVLFGFLFALVVAPSRLYFEQKDRGDLFTPIGIRLTVAQDSPSRAEPNGVILENGKDVDIGVSAKLVSMWEGKSSYAQIRFNDSFGWHEGSNTPAYDQAQIRSGKSKLLVFELVRTAEEKARPTLKAPRHAGVEDKGRSIGISTSGGGFAIYERRTYLMDVAFEFDITGVAILPPPIRFQLNFDGDRLHIAKISNWDDKGDE